VAVTDTSPAAQARQLEVLRSLPGEHRLLMAIEISLFARELAKEGIRQEHSEWSEAQVTHELVRRALLTAPSLSP